MKTLGGIATCLSIDGGIIGNEQIEEDIARLWIDRSLQREAGQEALQSTLPQGM